MSRGKWSSRCWPNLIFRTPWRPRLSIYFTCPPSGRKIFNLSIFFATDTVCARGSYVEANSEPEPALNFDPFSCPENYDRQITFCPRLDRNDPGPATSGPQFVVDLESGS